MQKLKKIESDVSGISRDWCTFFLRGKKTKNCILKALERKTQKLSATTGTRKYWSIQSENEGLAVL